jgi:uncharacterized membrane protein
MFATLAAGSLFFALPSALQAGPPWLLLSALAVLLLASVVARQRERHGLNQAFGITLLILLTLAMLWSLGALLWALPAHTESPRALTTSAILIWVANVLVFASWYWRLDGGGPNARDGRPEHRSDAFLFPQMQGLEPERSWRPGFVDYLFLAFTSSIAFSPTDTPVLSRWAKVAMMCQAVVSFATLAGLVARAVSLL